VFASDDRRTVREIGIIMDGQWDALKVLIGQNVTVSGILQLEPVSPYYLNGTLILAKSIRLQNGSVLLPQTKVVRNFTFRSRSLRVHRTDSFMRHGILAVIYFWLPVIISIAG
jgi:hypothetical protein